MKFFLLILFSIILNDAICQTPFKIVGDTIKIRKGELVIQNKTKNTGGIIFNIGNGKTLFKEVGKGLQFTVGEPGEPQPGDSLFSSNYYIGKSIKVWRNGLFQYNDFSNGVVIDVNTGKIVFHPKLVNRDRIYIEVMNGYN